MNLTAILLLSVSLAASASGFTQTISLSERNAPLQKVFKKIEQQSGYNFVYRNEWLKDAKQVNVQIKNATLQQVLDLCFKDQPFTYAIVDKVIVIKQKTEISNEQSQNSLSIPASIDVHGRVVNEDGQPLEGISVTIKGTRRGTATSSNGEFEFRAVYERSVLVFTGVNIESFEVNIQGRSELSLSARTKMSTTEAVIINKGYYTERQRVSTGNVSTVSSKDIERQIINNPLQAIQGRVPGLVITQQTGIPGGDFDVIIRGKNSLANGSDPLFIVDGVPYPSRSVASDPAVRTTYAGSLPIGGATPSPLNFINPMDIESIDVLKDADATAIYGSRGANGVILITTKKGKAGNTNADVNFYTGIGEVAHKLKMLNLQQYLAYRREAMANDGINPTSLDYDLNGTWDSTQFTNWQKEILGRKASYTNAQASVSGGNSLIRYLVNGGYYKESAIFPGDFALTRGSAHFNLNANSPNQKFNIQLSADYIATKNLLPYSDLIMHASLYPVTPKIHDAAGNLNWQNSTWQNPFAYFEVKSKALSKNLVSGVQMSYRIFKPLQLKANLGYNNLALNDLQAFPTTYFRPSLNRTTGNTDFSYNTITTVIAEPQVVYDANIRKGKLNAIVGLSFQDKKSDGLLINASGYPDNALLENLAGASTVTRGSAVEAQYHYNAVFGRIGYNWHDKYLLNLTARRDGSSRFGPGKQFANFGAAGLAWIFSGEKFISNHFPALSYGKLRLSYGTTGNDQVKDYRFLDLYSFTNFGTAYQNTQGLFPANLFNPDLAWESTKKAEAGLELGMWKDRLFTTISYFRHRSSNQLVKIPLPYTTGFDGIDANLPALVQNVGWEFILRGNPVQTRNFNWVLAGNLTRQRNTLVSFPGLSTSTYANIFVIGQPVTVKRVYDALGVNPQTGLYIFRTVNGKDTSNPSFLSDRTRSVSIDPDFFGGLQNTISYKNFELDLFFYFVKQVGKNYLFNSSILPGKFTRFTPLNWPVEILNNHWQKPGDIATVQKFSNDLGTAQTAYSAAMNSTIGYTDASYIRLKNASLAYQLPQALLKRMHLRRLRLYVQAQNLFTITNYRGYDPENQGGSIPPLRVYTGGIQLGL